MLHASKTRVLAQKVLCKSKLENIGKVRFWDTVQTMYTSE